MPRLATVNGRAIPTFSKSTQGIAAPRAMGDPADRAVQHSVPASSTQVTSATRTQSANRGDARVCQASRTKRAANGGRSRMTTAPATTRERERERDAGGGFTGACGRDQHPDERAQGGRGDEQQRPDVCDAFGEEGGCQRSEPRSRLLAVRREAGQLVCVPRPHRHREVEKLPDGGRVEQLTQRGPLRAAEDHRESRELGEDLDGADAEREGESLHRDLRQRPRERGPVDATERGSEADSARHHEHRRDQPGNV